MKGNQGMKSRLEPGGNNWRRAMEACYLLACSLQLAQCAFLYNPGPPAKVCITHSGLGRLAYRPKSQYCHFSIEILSSGAGGMPMELRVLAALAKALESIHRTHSSLQSSVTPVPGDLALPSGILGTWPVAHRHTGRQNTYMHWKKEKEKRADQAGYGGYTYNPDLGGWGKRIRGLMSAYITK